MPNVTILSVTAAGGRVVPSKPTLNHHTTTGQFVITDYNSSYTYSASVTAGTITWVSASVISLSNANSIATITARLPKSISNSSPATAERKAYTYSMSITNSYQHDWINGTPGACEGYSNWGTGPAGASGYACLDTGYNCQHSDAINVKNSTPSGYTDSYNEWWKVA